jgi:hypothetical protein
MPTGRIRRTASNHIRCNNLRVGTRVRGGNTRQPKPPILWRFDEMFRAITQEISSPAGLGRRLLRVGISAWDTHAVATR